MLGFLVSRLLVRRSPLGSRWMSMLPCIIVPRTRAEVEKRGLGLSDDPKAIEFKVAMHWAYSLQIVGLEKIAPRFYIHGLWPTEMGLPLTLLYSESFLIAELHQAILHFKHDLLKYWPNLHRPNDINLCASFIGHEWKKHGKNAGIRPWLYIEVTLAIGRAISENFPSLGISVGEMLTNELVLSQVNSIMKKLKINDLQIGHDTYPEFSCKNYNDNGISVINEVRLLFRGIFFENRADFWLIGPRSPFTGENLYLPSIYGYWKLREMDANVLVNHWKVKEMEAKEEADYWKMQTKEANTL